MKPLVKSPRSPDRAVTYLRQAWGSVAGLLSLLPLQAQAALFKGEALDTAADIMTWVVLIIAPVIAIGVFLMVHILPEKIAEKKHHPQAEAIKVLCLLSLFFGGMLWPLAWLWAYTKPVLHQLAYGTDKAVHEEPPVSPGEADMEELQRLRQRVAELELKLAGTFSADTRNV